MLVMCNNYVNTIRFKGNGFLDYPNDFNQFMDDVEVF